MDRPLEEWRLCVLLAATAMFPVAAWFATKGEWFGVVVNVIGGLGIGGFGVRRLFFR
jgi:hypothetical protein